MAGVGRGVCGDVEVGKLPNREQTAAFKTTNIKSPVPFTGRSGNMPRKSPLALEGAVRYLMPGRLAFLQ